MSCVLGWADSCVVIAPEGLLQTLGLQEPRSLAPNHDPAQAAQQTLPRPRSAHAKPDLLQLSLFPAIGDHPSPAKSPRHPSPFMNVAVSQPVPAFRTCDLQEKIICHRTLPFSYLCSCSSRHNVLWSLSLPLNHHSKIRPGSWIVLSILGQFAPTH